MTELQALSDAAADQPSLEIERRDHTIKALARFIARDPRAYDDLRGLIGFMGWADAAEIEATLRYVLLAASPSPGTGLDVPVDWEEFRKERGWPTPNHMRRAADALDSLTPARYGEVLRWVADACDRAIVPGYTIHEAPPEPEPVR